MKDLVTIFDNFTQQAVISVTTISYLRSSIDRRLILERLVFRLTFKDLLRFILFVRMLGDILIGRAIGKAALVATKLGICLSIFSPITLCRRFR